MRKKRVVEKKDKLLGLADSALDIEANQMNLNLPREMIVSGNMGIGKKGNPVTIFIEDEVTGETLELSGVKSAFVIVEDSRRSTSGWVSMAVGGVEKLSTVLNFLSQSTLESLRRLVNSDLRD